MAAGLPIIPRAHRDGTELWVNQFNGDLHVYTVDGMGDTFRVGNFRHSFTISGPTGDGCFYDLHPDGLRILQTGSDPAFNSEVSYLHLVTNWQMGLAEFGSK